MTEQEKIVGLEDIEQAEVAGKQIEKRIFEGKAVLIDEETRLSLKELMNKRGVDFSKVVPESLAENKSYVVEPNGLIEALGGKENMARVVYESMKSITMEKNWPALDGFVERYLESHINYSGVIEMDLDSGEVNDCKIVAIVSALHRVLRIIACPDQQSALEEQLDKQTTRLLRERLLRKKEKTSSVDSTGFEVARDDGNSKLRTLAENGVEAVLKAVMKLETK